MNDRLTKAGYDDDASADRRRIRTTLAIRRIQGGDAEGWHDLHRSLDGLVRKIARHDFRLDASDTDDISQTVWLKLWGWFERLDDPAAVPGWIATTTRRACITLLSRGAGPREVCSETIDDRTSDLEDPERAVLRAEDVAEVRAVLAGLSDDRRELLALLFADESPSYEAVARELGRSVGFIGPTRARALRQVESRLGGRRAS